MNAAQIKARIDAVARESKILEDGINKLPEWWAKRYYNSHALALGHIEKARYLTATNQYGKAAPKYLEKAQEYLSDSRDQISEWADDLLG